MTIFEKETKLATQNGVKIFVACHKEAKLPSIPGRELLLQNPVKIKNKNKSVFIGEDPWVCQNATTYCELATMHWAIENTDARIIGLEHYRRFFLSNKQAITHYSFLQPSEIIDELRYSDIIFPSKIRTPDGCVVGDDYRHFWNGNHYPGDFEALESSINEKFPEYAKAFNDITNKTYLFCPFNMIIGKKEFVQKYETWVFSVLDLVSKKIDLSNRTQQQKRVFGYLGEIMPTIWIEANPQIKVVYRDVLTISKPMAVHNIRHMVKTLFGLEKKNEI